MDWCIETEGLTRDFKKLRAVDHIALRVAPGTFYGFLGPNGAGKSTTIKMLTGLLAPSAGTIRLLDIDFAQHPLDIKRRIGVVPEDLCLYENLTGHEYLTFIGRMYGLDRPTIVQRRGELLALMGLQDAESTLVREYSHGMKKKLSLTAALIHDPELLFLDEPFEGIDALASRTIRITLNKLVARGSTIFLTSHILEIVEKLCSHVGIIDRGQLVRQGTIEELARGGSLESAFIDVVGVDETAPVALSWLEETA